MGRSQIPVVQGSSLIDSSSSSVWDLGARQLDPANNNSTTGNTMDHISQGTSRVLPVPEEIHKRLLWVRTYWDSRLTWRNDNLPTYDSSVTSIPWTKKSTGNLLIDLEYDVNRQCMITNSVGGIMTQKNKHLATSWQGNPHRLISSTISRRICQGADWLCSTVYHTICPIIQANGSGTNAGSLVTGEDAQIELEASGSPPHSCNCGLFSLLKIGSNPIWVTCFSTHRNKGGSGEVRTRADLRPLGIKNNLNPAP